MVELKRAKGWYEAKKKKRFKSFIKEFRKKSIRLIKKGKRKLRDLQKPYAICLKDYQKICRKFTELTIQHESIDISNRGWGEMHIDHIIPVYHAWKMRLSPYLIGMSANLQKISKIDNQKKGMKQTLICQFSQTHN